MGLAASQARALLLVARKSDLEYRSQCLTQRKMVLAQQTEQLARDYSNKISNRKLSFVYNIDGSSGETKTEDLSYYSLKNNAKFVGDYRVLDSFGNIVVASINEIPKVKKEVPVYTKVQTNEDGTTAKDKDGNVIPIVNADPVYSQVTNDLFNKNTGSSTDPQYTALWAATLKENGETSYVQVQYADGSINPNATIKTKKDGQALRLFAYTGKGEEPTVENDKASYENYQINESVLKSTYLNKQTKGASYITTTDDKSKDPSYVALGNTEFVEVDRQPSADGYYYSDDGRRYVVASIITNKNYFQNGLRNGALTLEQASTVDKKDDLGNKIGEVTSWNSTPWQGLSIIQDSYDTSDDAQAESDYEAKTAALKAQDQMLDMEIKQIETQHKAVETEWDSIKKIIDGNIDKTFKIFA